MEGFLGVGTDGLFEPKSIVGDDFVLVPKEFDKEDLWKCVYRKEHVAAVVKLLQHFTEKPNIPGLYLQGPAGVGKSVIIYTITQIAKFHFSWLTVYVPNCKDWRIQNKAAAMGYFLDRVLDAFSAEHLQKKFPNIWDLLKDSQTEPPKRRHWQRVVVLEDDGETKVKRTYEKVLEFLQTETNDTPVLLVFDEVNALWDSDRNFFADEPWRITDFATPHLDNGALLVSGTTDSEFQGTIPAGYDRECVYCVGEFDPEETELMLKTRLGRPMKRIRDFDERLWHEIFDACGNIPRELRGFAKCLKDFSSRIEAAVNDEPARKKLKVDISSAIKDRREDNHAHHYQSVIYVIKKDQKENISTFNDAFFAWCRNYFLENELHGRLEILRVPNFVVSNSTMRPTTADASRAYFDWFLDECSKRPDAELDSVARSLDIISTEESDVNGSERGHAFERYLSSKLTLCGNKGGFRLNYHRLNETPTQCHSFLFQVTNRVYAKADSPPKNFRNYPAGTFLTHVDRDGGQARVDMILYSGGEVIFIEATVGNYRATKLPTMEDDKGRATKIRSAVCKWLGKDVYKVAVDKASSELSVTYRSDYTSRSQAERPDPPTVHYVVITTCPLSVQPTAERKAKYNWIKVCFLEDLITTGIIPANFLDQILNAQAKEDARIG